MTHTHHDGFVCLFRLKVDRKHFIEVFIWKDKESLWAAHPDMEPDFRGCFHHVVFSAWIPNGKRKKSKLCLAHKAGEIHLIENGYGSRAVAHEIQHFMNDWTLINKLDLEKDDEKIAGLCGNLHMQFWREHYKQWD